MFYFSASEKVANKIRKKKKKKKKKKKRAPHLFLEQNREKRKGRLSPTVKRRRGTRIVFGDKKKRSRRRQQPGEKGKRETANLPKPSAKRGKGPFCRGIVRKGGGETDGAALDPLTSMKEKKGKRESFKSAASGEKKKRGGEPKLFNADETGGREKKEQKTSAP